MLTVLSLVYKCTDDLPEIYPATVLPEMLIQHVQCQMRTRVDQDAELDH